MTDHIENCEISNAAQKIRDGASDMQTAVVAQASKACEKTRYNAEQAIKASPYKSMLIAMGAGIAVGAWVFRRRSCSASDDSSCA